MTSYISIGARRFRSIVVVSFASALLFTAPFVSSAAAAAQTTDVASLIAQLQAQIAALQAQIYQLSARQEGQFCYTFNKNLRVGDIGEGVAALQKLLEKEGFSVPDSEKEGLSRKAVFGEGTAAAVVNFQEKYREEILAPAQLPRGNGFVGELVRAKLNKLYYGCEVSPPQPPFPPPPEPPLPPGPVVCPNLPRSLYLGLRGDDVSALQQFLRSQGYFTYSTNTGYFGPSTEQAVQNFQKEMRIVSSGDPETTGFGVVGKQTREAIANTCGGGDGDGGDGGGDSIGNRPPVISGVSGPTSLQIGEQGTWTVNAYDPENGTLSYFVIWGDENLGIAAPQAAAPSLIQQTATLTHSYATGGNYTPVFYVTDNANQQAKTSISVVVGNISNEWIKEQVKCVFNGSSAEQRCYTSGLEAVLECSGVNFCVVDNVPGWRGEQIIWKSSCGGYAYTTVDGQDEHATFQCGISTQPSITVLSPNGGETLRRGESYSITWTRLENIPPLPAATTFDISLVQYQAPCPVGQACILSMPMPHTIVKNYYNKESGNGVYPWIVGSVQEANRIVNDGAYYIQVCRSGTSVCDSSDSYFKITTAEGKDTFMISKNKPAELAGYTPGFGKPFLITDGVIAPEGTGWTNSQYAVQLRAIGPSGNRITIDLGALYNISHITVQADDNDTYRADYSVDPFSSDRNIAEWKLLYDVPYSSGGGLRSRTRDVSEVSARYVRIYATGGDGSYSISELMVYGTPVTTQQSSITVLSPNGGEVYNYGDNIKIQAKIISQKTSGTVEVWLIDNIDNYTRFVASSNGVNLFVTNGIVDYGQVVVTEIPSKSSYKIKITWKSGDDLEKLTDESDAPFSIVAAPTTGLSADLKVNGSDQPAAVSYNSQFTVSWSSSGAKYCAAYGHHIPQAKEGSWNDLNNLPISGSVELIARHNTYGFFTPLQVSIQCSNGAISSTDTVYVPVTQQAQPSVTVTSPNGGEVWQLNSSHTILWTPYDPQTNLNTYPTVQAYLDRLVNGNFVEVGKIIPSGKASIHWVGEINQYNQYPTPGDYYIRLVNTQTGASDRSNQSFKLVAQGTIKADLKINGSDGPISVASDGKPIAMTASWSSNTDTCVLSNNTVPLDDTSGQRQFTNLSAAGDKLINVFPNLNFYNMPMPINLWCTAKVPEGQAFDNVEVSASNIGSFVSISAPNGGEQIALNALYNISVRHSTDISRVSLMLYRNDASFRTIVADWPVITTSGTDDYVWKPSDILTTADLGEKESAIYKVYVIGYRSTGGATVTDISDSPFSIVAATTQTKSVDLSATPMSGQAPLAVSFTGTLSNFPSCGNTITWTWGDGRNESMAESCAGTINVFASRVITRSHTYSSAGTYTARMTVGSIPSNDITITVTSAPLPTQPSVTMTSPNVGENWEVGKTYPITWTTSAFPSSAVVLITLYDTRYATGDARNAAVVATLTNTGSYNWAVPQSLGQLSGGALGASSVYKMRAIVVDAALGSKFDESNGLFSIVAPPPPPPPDLEIYELYVTPSNPLVNETVIISYRIRNNGGPLSSNFSSGIGSPVEMETLALGPSTCPSWPSSSLGIGQSCSNQQTVRYTKSGTYWVLASVNLTNNGQESNSTNNTASLQLIVGESSQSPAGFSLDTWTGTWNNENSATDFNTRLAIALSGANFVLHPWSSCCDWGERTVAQTSAIANNTLSFDWSESFKTVRYTLTLLSTTRLHAVSKTTYTNGQPGHTKDEYFTKSVAVAPINQTGPPRVAGEAGLANTLSAIQAILQRLSAYLAQ